MKKAIGITITALALQFALAQQPEATTLTPEMDWVTAFIEGGNYVLEPGVYSTSDYLELTNDLALQGSGEAGDTVLLLDSDGGDYGEQFAVVGYDANDTVRVTLTNLTMEHGGSYVSDIITAFGNVQLELDHVRVLNAFDDLVAFNDPESEGLYWGVGLFATYGPRVIVKDSEFSGNNKAFMAREAARVIITNTTFTDNPMGGIEVLHGPLTVTTSHFSGGEYGISVVGAFEGILIGNVIED